MFQSISTAIGSVIVTIHLIGCGMFEGKGKARVAFKADENAALALADGMTPTVFEMKLIAVYLAEELNADGSNRGKTAMIYLNPECGGNISSCDIGNISTFFDFARPAAEVNAQINNEAQEVEPGEFNYVRMEFCKYADGADANLRFQTAEMDEPHAFVQASCTVNSLRAASPIKVKEDKTVRVELSYDYTGSVVTYSPSNGVPDSCVVVDDETMHCFQLPDFNPAAYNE